MTKSNGECKKTAKFMIDEAIKSFTAHTWPMDKAIPMPTLFQSISRKVNCNELLYYWVIFCSFSVNYCVRYYQNNIITSITKLRMEFVTIFNYWRGVVEKRVMYFYLTHIHVMKRIACILFHVCNYEIRRCFDIFNRKQIAKGRLLSKKEICLSYYKN